MKKYGIFGFDIEGGGLVSGAAGGPNALRKRNLLVALNAMGLTVKDFGNTSDFLTQIKKIRPLAKEKGILDFENVYNNNKTVYKKVSEICKRGYFPIVIGGDHSLSIGSVAAIANHYQQKNKQIGLIWIDTHPDYNTPKTSPSMRAFGMPVAILSGRVPGHLANLNSNRISINEKNIAFVGLRDVDPGEREYIKKNKITAYSIKEIDTMGIASVIHRALEVATRGTSGFVVSFDLDVCDPTLVPGTGTPHRGGLSFREAHLAMELLYESKAMLGLELVELNPRLDKSHTTADFAISLIESALGKTIL